MASSPAGASQPARRAPCPTSRASRTDGASVGHERRRAARGHRNASAPAPASTPGSVGTMPVGGHREGAQVGRRQYGSATLPAVAAADGPAVVSGTLPRGATGTACGGAPVPGTSERAGRRRRRRAAEAATGYWIRGAGCRLTCRCGRRGVGHVAARGDRRRLRRTVETGPDAGCVQLAGQRRELRSAERQVAFGVYRRGTHLYSWNWSTATPSRTASASSVSTAREVYSVTR